MSDLKNNQAMAALRPNRGISDASQRVVDQHDQKPRPDDFDLNDFDGFAQQARNEAEVAEVAVALTKIANNQHDVKLLMQGVTAALANRAKHEATRDAALVNRLVSPSDLNEAARVGSYYGAKDFGRETVKQFNEVVSLVNKVNWSFKQEFQARAIERKAWIEASQFAACTSAFLILAAASIGYCAGLGAGAANGYAKARDEKAAANWANTSNGRFAQILDDQGSLTDMRNCTGSQWYREKRHGRQVCFAGQPSGSGSLRGWFLK